MYTAVLDPETLGVFLFFLFFEKTYRLNKLVNVTIHDDNGQKKRDCS